MFFTLGENSVDIDVKATEEIYEDRIEAFRQCFCSSCRNYQERIRRIDAKLAMFFSSLGVDPAKPDVVWAYLPGEQPATQQYACIFPLVYTDAQIMTERSLVEIEPGLLAGFELREGKAVLALDWTMRWVYP